MVPHVLSMLEALGIIPSIQRETDREKEEEEAEGGMVGERGRERVETERKNKI